MLYFQAVEITVGIVDLRGETANLFGLHHKLPYFVVRTRFQITIHENLRE
jgi:hypothetical protein